MTTAYDGWTLDDDGTTLTLIGERHLYVMRSANPDRPNDYSVVNVDSYDDARQASAPGEPVADGVTLAEALELVALTEAGE